MPMFDRSSGGVWNRGENRQPNVSLPWANAETVRFRAIVAASCCERAAVAVELLEVDPAGREGEGQGQLQVAPAAEGVGDVLLVGHRVEGEGDDRPAGPT